MTVFYTQLPLLDTVTAEDCLKVIMEWVQQCPRYAIKCTPFDYKNAERAVYKKGNAVFSIYKEKPDRLVCRVENRSGRITWLTELLLCEKEGMHAITIRVLRSGESDGDRPHRVIKPAIVRRLLELGYCRADKTVPVTDTVLDADGTYYATCVQLLNGQKICDMPAVLVSCDSAGRHAVKASYLAAQLGGMAHVFTQRDPRRFQGDVSGNGFEQGDVTVHYPEDKAAHFYWLKDFADDRAMNWAIINDIRIHLSQGAPPPRS